MRVLLCAKSHYSNLNSCDTDLIFNIYNYLKRQNVQVDICGANEEVDYKKYDIVHLFDIKNIFDTYKHYKLASCSGCKIVVSPMYFNMNRFYDHIENQERKNSWNRCRIYRETIINKSSLILCNSNFEKNLILKDFTPRCEPTVIYNGVKIRDGEIPLYNFKERYNLDSYILSVGRICDFKNQLTLSKVCEEIGIPLVLVGTPADPDYLKQCLKYKGTHYLGFMNEYDLYNAYTFSTAHVLASFLEVTSMSSLKAASYGCNIVVTEEGASKEYFNDLAIYCDPYKYESISLAVEDIIKKRKSDKLRDYVKNNYNVEVTLKQIYKSYLKLIQE
ncbi:MAG: glycosyltransferase [Clostridium sp.]|nr:glycosyltransferase [Clostridium sp.]